MYEQCSKAANNDERAEAKVFTAPTAAWVVTIYVNCVV